MLQGIRPRTLQEAVLLVIGVFTPIAILAVNASAFVMQHLAQIRVGLAGAALVSGLLLNGLAAWSALAFLSRATASLFREYRLWLGAVAVVYVVAWSVVTAYWTYLGMQDPRRLPDRIAILASLAALVLPFVLNNILRLIAGKREARPSPPAAPLDEPPTDAELARRLRRISRV